MVRLQQNIEDLKAASGQDNEEEKVLHFSIIRLVRCQNIDDGRESKRFCLFVLSQERKQLIDKQYNTDREKLQRIRLLMVTTSTQQQITGSRSITNEVTDNTLLITRRQIESSENETTNKQTASS